MLEKPDIPEQLISSAIKIEYDLDVKQVTFLPLGYDVNTAVYRVDTFDEVAFFLKLRRGDFHEITVELPHFLHQSGISTIIPPVATSSGQLSGKLGDNVLILYQYIPGKDGYQVQLTDQHWYALGQTLRKVHSCLLPNHLHSMIPQEMYDPAWRNDVSFFQAQVGQREYADPVAQKVAAFLKSKQPDITWLVRRTNELAQSLCSQDPDFTLCHSDAHPGNFLIAETGELYLVDWDNPIFAPKERDLMFFGAGMSTDWPGGREEALFYQGYGEVEVNQQALVYYRYERIIEDIAEFCKQLLLSDGGGEDREQAYHYLTSSFEPGSVLEAARESDHRITHSC